MGDNLTSPVQAEGFRRVLIAGAFKPNTTSAIDNTLNKGKGFTVAYTSTGRYTVTLTHNYPSYACVLCSMQLNAGTLDFTVGVLGAIDLVTNKTFDICTLTGGTLTDVTAATNSWIHFMVMALNTSVTP